MNPVYHCVIIEDEPLAQNVLKKYIEDHPALVLAGVCNNALDAQIVLPSQPVQLLFLDISLPGLSGINFLKSLSHPPLVIFTTAYPEFAVEGFELDAVDYLLKPFSFERFLKAVNKAIEKINFRNWPATGSESSYPGFIFLKADKKIHKIDLADILYIEAVGDYMKVVTETGQLMVNETLKKMQEELPAIQFIRVHKSFIIAGHKIRYFEGNFVQVGNKSIPIGATYRDEVFSNFEKKN
jgi:DNA-binding LytR/AlgR family response regulator